MKANDQPLETAESVLAHAGVKIPSPWRGNHEHVTPVTLNRTFGDGRQRVILSFYAAPELCVIVPFDSKLPLDLSLFDRCQESPTVRSFRDIVDAVYDALQEQFNEPPVTPYREGALREELEDDEHSLWDVILRDGATWCLW